MARAKSAKKAARRPTKKKAGKRVAKKANKKAAPKPTKRTAKKSEAAPLKATRKSPAKRGRNKPAKPATRKSSCAAKGAAREATARPIESAAAPRAAAVPPKAKKSQRKRVTAETMSGMQREISISEFFTKNRHLLGFDNASRALLTSVKEAVDNSLDACEEASILPDIIVRIEQRSEKRFCICVEDNGPGIVKSQIPKVFGKLLYGSKFHRLQQSRGQQGIGISAAGMYGQLTTGKPVLITSKTGPSKDAHYYEINIDTAANRPRILQDKVVDWGDRDHGTSVTIEMEASYKGGKRSVDEYIQTVAVANPHARIEYWRPGKPPIVYPRITETLPRETREIKPHPYGVELGVLMRMLQGTSSRTLQGFLSSEFSRVSSKTAGEMIAAAGIDATIKPKELTRQDTEALYRSIGQTKLMSPPTDCLAPIGEAALYDGLKALLVQQRLMAEEARLRRKERDGVIPTAGAEQALAAAESKVVEALESIKQVAGEPDDDGKAIPEAAGAKADTSQIEKAGVIELFGKPVFLTAVSRSPKVYRGNPFLVEAALGYGGDLSGDDLAQIYRFANRVPLLYQQGACAMTQGALRTKWKSYNVPQSRGALPTAPLIILVHIASVWVPFTSEAKEAVAHYDEIIGELKFALQECGRRLSRHITRRRRADDADKKRRYIQSYIPHIGIALQEILALTDRQRDKTVDELTGILERSRKM